MMRAKVLASMVALMLVSGIAFADLEDDGYAEVSVNVVANISVDYLGSVVVMPDIQTGAFSGSITFSVEANKQEIDMWVAVSDLYKDDAPASQYRIPVDTNVKVGVEPAMGQELPTGEDNALEIIPETVSVGPYPIGYNTVLGHFGSGENNHFSQDVTVTPTWIQSDNELPIGEYSGMVILTALVQ